MQRIDLSHDFTCGEQSCEQSFELWTLTGNENQMVFCEDPNQKI
jgi:hypothetical protein